MAMNDVFRIASSALAAQSQRLNTTASNLANAESAAGPDGRVYRAKQVVFRAEPLVGMFNIISDSRSYQTNFSLIHTTKTLMLKALTLGN